MHPSVKAPPARRPGRAASLPAEERRQAIIAAVIPLLVERGADLTTRQIAEAAGVAEGTLFSVFEDKHALLHAAAHAMLDPGQGRRSLDEVDAGLGLEAMVTTVTEQLLEQTAQVMAVLMAVRATAGTDRADRPDPKRRGRHGPPAFVRDWHRALLDGLTELFGRYRDELRIEPARAAPLMRALVFGSRPPWADEWSTVTSAEIAGVLLAGVARPEASC